MIGTAVESGPMHVVADTGSSRSLMIDRSLVRTEEQDDHFRVTVDGRCLNSCEFFDRDDLRELEVDGYNPHETDRFSFKQMFETGPAWPPPNVAQVITVVLALVGLVRGESWRV